jgi:hypothetical protein
MHLLPALRTVRTRNRRARRLVFQGQLDDLFPQLLEQLQGNVFDLSQVRLGMALFPGRIFLDELLRFGQQAGSFLFLIPFHGYLLRKEILVFTWHKYEMNSAITPSEQLTPPKFRFEFSESTGSRYWVNICQYCKAIRIVFCRFCAIIIVWICHSAMSATLTVGRHSSD